MITFNMIFREKKNLNGFHEGDKSQCHHVHDLLENLSQAGNVAVIMGVFKKKPTFYKVLSPLQKDGEKVSLYI